MIYKIMPDHARWGDIKITREINSFMTEVLII